MNDLTLIKLGGSLITNKSIPFKVELDILNKITREIKSSIEEFPQFIIVGHGGGSFPHVFAKQYDINRGFITDQSYFGFAEVQNAAAQLNRIVVKTFLDQRMNAVSVSIANICRQKSGIIYHCYSESISGCLENNIIPVLYGDVTFDDTLGCSVISTEEIFRYLCENFSYKDYTIKRIIIAGNVEGVMTADPNVDNNAHLIKKITSTNSSKIINALGGAKGFDVTGGMKHKVEKMLAVKRGITIQIIDGTVPGNISRALHGENMGTIIEN
jgi:isopentenyl phosphate kinase